MADRCSDGAIGYCLMGLEGPAVVGYVVESGARASGPVNYAGVLDLRLRLGERRWAILKWWLVGLSFAAVNIPMLYVLRDAWGLPLALATLIGGELGTLCRFVVNDRWVFGNAKLSWRRLVEYHGAVLSSAIIWWGVTNLLPQWGVHYLLASIAGQACSVGWSMVTNFLWVWRKQTIGTLPVLQPSVRAGRAGTTDLLARGEQSQQ
jgi:putative flippase GtrA